MPTFVVESYAPAGAIGDQRVRAERAAELGRGITYTRTTVVPADQVLLHQFEAASSAVLREAVAAAGLGCDRIVEVLEIADHGASSDRGST